MDVGAWQATIHGVAKSRTQLSDFTFFSSFFLIAQLVDDLPAMQVTRFDPWVGKIPWRRKWQPTPVFLPGESHGQRSLAGYCLRGCKSWT